LIVPLVFFLLLIPSRRTFFCVAVYPDFRVRQPTTASPACPFFGDVVSMRLTSAVFARSSSSDRCRVPFSTFLVFHFFLLPGRRWWIWWRSAQLETPIRFFSPSFSRLFVLDVPRSLGPLVSESDELGPRPIFFEV